MAHKISRIALQRVRYMPKELKPGVLYVSEEFGTAAHLCACGCGAKIRTPLGPTEWTLEVTPRGPSISPSIGNWQQPCKSHYWINAGEIRWAGAWSPEMVKAGRQREEAQRQAYYASRDRQRDGWFKKLWRWVVELVS